MAEAFVTKLSKRECFTLSEHDSLKSASEKLQKYNIGAIPILSKQNNDVIGIVSERDLARFIFKDEFKDDLPVTKIMTKQIITCNLNNSVSELMEIMTHNKIRHIPIVDGKKILGIVSIGDVLNHIIQQYKDENKHLKDYVNL
jgi:signal-transduction protein with cAMP-binding, CBS, and nucleotidyltransferase domain